MSPGRDTSTAPSLPPSVEAAYRTKCIQLRQRMQEVEQANDEYRARRERLVRGIRKMRLERAILLETLSKRMQKGRSSMDGGPLDDDTEDSTDSPPTPQERPMRIKRSHRRPDASFIHESTPSRPTGNQEESSNRGGDNAGGPGSEAGGNGEDGIARDEDMADAPGGSTVDANESRGRSGEYGGRGGSVNNDASNNDHGNHGSHGSNHGNNNNGDTQSNAGDSEMAQD